MKVKELLCLPQALIALTETSYSLELELGPESIFTMLRQAQSYELRTSV
jgi:hypothetical protein